MFERIVCGGISLLIGVSACTALGSDAAPRTTPAETTAAAVVGAPLIVDQKIQPIDLANTLRLAGARDLDVAIARERVCRGVAELPHRYLIGTFTAFMAKTQQGTRRIRPGATPCGLSRRPGARARTRPQSC